VAREVRNTVFIIQKISNIEQGITKEEVTIRNLVSGIRHPISGIRFRESEIASPDNLCCASQPTVLSHSKELNSGSIPSIGTISLSIQNTFGP